MWQSGMKMGRKVRGLPGSGGTKTFALGYYDALCRQMPQHKIFLLNSGVTVDRAMVNAPNPIPKRAYWIEVASESGDWEEAVRSSKSYCEGYFYGLTDPLPTPHVRMMFPDGKVFDESCPRGAPAPARSPVCFEPPFG